MSNLVKTDFLVDPQPIVGFLVYLGPHVIAGGGCQMVFDFGGGLRATLNSMPEYIGLELMIFGLEDMQLHEHLDASAALEILKGMVQR
jgi:hypothetical protein